MSAGEIPSTPAQAPPLSGWVVRNSTSCATSQLDRFWVPPYRPAVEPDMTRAPEPLLEPEADADEVGGGGALVGDEVKGSGPDEAVDCNSTGFACACPMESTTISAVPSPTTSAPTPSPAGRRHQGRRDGPGEGGGWDGGAGGPGGPGGGGTEDPAPDEVLVGCAGPAVEPPTGAPESGPEGGPDGPVDGG
jgi:hypothetical protein